MINKFIGSHITFFFLPHIFFNLFIFLSYSKFFFFFFSYINMDRCIYTDQIPICHKGFVYSSLFMWTDRPRSFFLVPWAFGSFFLVPWGFFRVFSDFQGRGKKD